MLLKCLILSTACFLGRQSCTLGSLTCADQPSCQACTCSNLLTKYQLDNGNYACDGTKCTSTQTICVLHDDVDQCASCEIGYVLMYFTYCRRCAPGDEDLYPAQCTRCSQGQYQINNVCHSCTANRCAKCNVQENECSSCIANAIKSGTDCICQYGSQRADGSCPPEITCQQGQYLNNNICNNCIQYCIACSTSNQCDTCKDGYYFTQIDVQYICSKCSQNCLKCHNQQNNCTVCSSDRELTLLNTCACKTGYYEQNNQCVQCQLPCLKCSSSQICQECQLNQLIYLNSNQFCQCQDGYYYNYKNLICELCNLTCKTCTSTSNNCSSCFEEQNRILENNQCICQDNYFENSLKQCISCKSQAALTIEKCNYANCNDNVWSYGEQCDDGNQLIKDGCNNCQIEQSFYCINQVSQPSQCFRCPDNCINCQYQNNKVLCTNVIDGYFINDLNDIQKCNEKCLNCYNQASNCLECKYLNIKNSSINCQFCEYKQGYYTNFENNKCYTKCGDGLVADVEQCDDGNLQNGDGCDNQCQLEKQYNCSNDICMKQDVPYPISYVNYTQDQFSTIRQVFVSYNQLLNLTECFNISNHIQVQIIDQYSNQIQSPINIMQNLQLNSQNGSNLTFIVECNFNESHEKIQLQINYSEPIQIKNTQNVYQEVSLISIKLDDVIITSQEVKIYTQSAVNTTNYLIYYLLILVILGVFFGGIDIYYNLLDTIQNFSYFHFMNTQFPYNLERFFQNLQFVQITIVQDYFNLQNRFSDFFHIDLQTIKESVPIKIEQQGYTSSFLINFATVFFAFLTSGFLLLFAYIYLRLIRFYEFEGKLISSSNIFRKAIVKGISKVKFFLKQQSMIMVKKFIFSGFLRLFMASANEFCLAISLGLLNLKFDNVYLIVNWISTIVCLLLYINIFVFSLALVQYQKKYSLKTKIVEDKFGSVFEDLELKQFALLYNPIVLIKKFLQMLFLVQCYSQPLQQVIQITILNIVFFYYLYNCLPLKDTLEQKKQSICQLQQIITLLIFDFLVLNEKLEIVQQSTLLLLGWISIGNVLIALSTQIIFDTVQQLKLYHQKYVFVRQICQNIQKLFKKQPKKATHELFSI